jgi:hypothetical protein
MLVKMKGERNPHTLLVGMKISSVTMGIIMESSQKAKVKLLCYSAIGFLGTLKKTKLTLGITTDPYLSWHCLPYPSYGIILGAHQQMNK